MALSTLEGRGDFLEGRVDGPGSEGPGSSIVGWGKIWIPMGFLVTKEVVNRLPLTALKYSSDWVQESGGRI